MIALPTCQAKQIFQQSQLNDLQSFFCLASRKRNKSNPKTDSYHNLPKWYQGNDGNPDDTKATRETG